MRQGVAFFFAVFALTAAAGAQASAGRVAGSIFNPAWSPDGKLIAWREVVAGAESRIWIAAPNMAKAHPVTPAIDALGQIAWLPGDRLLYWANFRLFALKTAGRRSLFARVPGGDFAVDRRGTKVATGDAPCSLGCYGPVLVFDLHGGPTRRVGGAKVQNMSPTFSPDGTRVAFHRIFCEQTGRCEQPAGIWIASVASGKLRRITTGNQGCPNWSPNGRAIAYIDLGDVTDQPLRVIRAAGGASTLLAHDVGCDLSFPPQWSPDSRSVAFASRTTGQLVTVNVISHRSRAVTGIGIGAVNGFAWSPDSSKLLVTAGLPNCSALWLVEVKTSAARKLRGC